MFTSRLPLSSNTHGNRHLRRVGAVPASSLIAIVLVLMLLATPGMHAVAQTASTSPAASPMASPVGSDDPRLAQIKPAQRAWADARLPKALSAYSITTSIDPVGKLIHGSLTLDYVNDTGTPLHVLPFRLYANAGETELMTVSDVRVANRPVNPTMSVNNTVVAVPLADALAPNETIRISMTFSLTVPVDNAGQYGMLSIDSNTGTWALAEWYPILAGWDPANGFELDPPSVNGDPVFSTTSLYDVRLTAPEGWSVVSSGNATTSAPNSSGTRQWTIETGPVRDITLVADADFESVSTVVDGTAITSWFNPGGDRSGKAALTYATQAIELFDTLLVPYPYTTFDVVPVELYGAAGVEFPNLIFIAQAYYGPDEDLSAGSDFEFTVAHEVVHQWFYGLVGNNQYLHAFTDEGMTNFLSSKIYFDRVEGNEVGDRVYANAAKDVFVSVALAGQDQIVDTPTDAFPSGYAYAWAAYAKAPVGFNAIYEQVGADAFFAGLRDYINAFAFSVAQPTDMQDAFSTAAGTDIGPLWQRWFEEKHGAEDATTMQGWHPGYADA